MLGGSCQFMTAAEDLIIPPPSSSDASTGQCFQLHNHTLEVRVFFRVGGGHDSYTFQCGLVGSFTSPGIATR